MMSKDEILSEDLKLWRAERPDEWIMEEFIRKAKRMEKQLQNTSSNSDYAKCKEAYIDGYESGHNDTVESCYGWSDEKADEWISEHFA